MSKLEERKRRQAEISTRHDKTAGAQQRELVRIETRRLEKQAAQAIALAKKEEQLKAAKLAKEKEDRLRSLRLQQEVAKRRREEEKKAKESARNAHLRQQAELERLEEEKRQKKAEDVKRYRRELAEQIAYRESVERKKLAMSAQERAMNDPLLHEIEVFARRKGRALNRTGGKGRGLAAAGELLPRAKQSTIALG